MSRKGDINRTGRKLLIGKCVKCNGKKSMFVNDHTIEAEGQGNFFKNLEAISQRHVKKLVAKVMKNPEHAL